MMRDKGQRPKLVAITRRVESDPTRCPQHGKVKHGSRDKAEAACRAIRSYARAYKCDVCGAWHVTKQPPRRARRARR